MKNKASLQNARNRLANRANRILIVFMCAYMAVSLGACAFGRPPVPAFVAEEREPGPLPLVRLDFEYEDADATAVALLWSLKQRADSGVNQRAEAPITQMKTAMKREGDLFRVRIAAPVGFEVDFSLLIAKETLEGLVEGEQAIDAEQLFVANEYGVVRIRSVQTLIRTYAYAIFMPAPRVQQEVIYRAASAGEVYLVWSVEDGQLLPESMRPPNTQATGRFMYTPMTMQHDGFRATVEAPAGVDPNYSFVITKNRKGETVQIWETSADDGQPTGLIEGRLDLVAAPSVTESAAAPSQLPDDFAPPVVTLLGLIALFMTALLAKRFSGRQSWTLKEAPLVTTAATGFSLCAALIVIHIYMAGIGWISWQTTLPFIASVARAAIPDLIYASVVTIAFSMLLLYAWPNQPACRLICGAFSVMMVVSIGFALANAVMLHTLGVPFVALGPALLAMMQGVPSETTLPVPMTMNLLISIVTLSASALIASYLPQLLLSLILSGQRASTIRKHYVYVPVGKFNQKTHGVNRPLQSMIGRQEQALLPYNPEL